MRGRQGILEKLLEGKEFLVWEVPSEFRSIEADAEDCGALRVRESLVIVRAGWDKMSPDGPKDFAIGGSKSRAPWRFFGGDDGCVIEVWWISWGKAADVSG